MITLTDLERELCGPEAADARHRLRQQLTEIEHRLRNDLAAGVTTAHYQDLQAGIDACRAAAYAVQAMGVGRIHKPHPPASPDFSE